MIDDIRPTWLYLRHTGNVNMGSMLQLSLEVLQPMAEFDIMANRST